MVLRRGRPQTVQLRESRLLLRSSALQLAVERPIDSSVVLNGTEPFATERFKDGIVRNEDGTGPLTHPPW